MNIRYINRLRTQISNTSIFTRIVFGNSVIIIVGAIGGTTITHRFTEQGRGLFPIMVFALIGLTLSVFINMWIVRAALKPLLELRKFVDNVEKVEGDNDPVQLQNPDSDTTKLASSLGSLIKQLEASNNQLRIISSQTIRAQEEERKRIARSLHDDTGQALSNLIITLQRLEMSIPEDTPETKSRLANIRESTTGILNDLRKTIYGLRPSILDDLGLVPSIRWYARTNLEEVGIKLNCILPDEPIELPADISTSLFRIVQEAINNIAKHANAKRATISLKKNSKQISLTVEDDGCGFSTATNQAEAIRMHHWGLVGIRERVDLVGGRFEIESTTNKGTILRVSVPLLTSKETMNG